MLSVTEGSVQIQCRPLSEPDTEPLDLKKTYPPGMEPGFEDLWVSYIEWVQQQFKSGRRNFT